MNRIAGSRLDETISDIKSGDEIENLSNIFNDMVSSLKGHIDDRIAHEHREQEMKYSLLLSQIDPHFICNTMNIINFLAREERCKEVIEINTALISLLQDRLGVEDFRILDTVAQEIKAVRDYLLIQNYRYENNATIDWRVDDEVSELNIPKNIIQPLVENALFHGLMDEGTGEIRGHVVIEIRKIEDSLLVCVQDDGKGIDAEKLNQLSKYETKKEERGKHIGLRNIRERLTYLYHQTDCMVIESNVSTESNVCTESNMSPESNGSLESNVSPESPENHEGTTVSIKLPILKTN